MKMKIAAAPKPVRARIVAKAHLKVETAPKLVLAPCCATEHSANQDHLFESGELEMAVVQNGPTPAELNWHLLKK